MILNVNFANGYLHVISIEYEYLEKERRKLTNFRVMIKIYCLYIHTYIYCLIYDLSCLIWFTARLQLSAIVGTSNKAIPESRLLSIDGGTRVTITCRGSGNLSWSSSSGVPIPSFTGSTTGIYQRRDITTSIQELTIQPFGTTYQSEYTCSNLNNADISESILLANCKFCKLLALPYSQIIFFPLPFSFYNLYSAIDNLHIARCQCQHNSGLLYCKCRCGHNHLVLQWHAN